ncbi:MAG: YihY/virulence factor BrkB family protein [Methanothrix sp.]
MTGKELKNGNRPLRERFKEVERRLYEGADQLSGGALGLLVATFKSMLEANAQDAAAAIAFYALFSIFPLLILLVILGSSFLETEENSERLINFISDILPPAKELAEENIQRVQEIGTELEVLLPLKDLIRANFQHILNLRVPVGIVALTGLFWSATSVFEILARNIDRAWSGSEGRNFLEWRLVSIAMVGSLLIGLLVLSMVIVSFFGLLDRIAEIFLGDATAYQTPIESTLFYRLVPDVVIFVTITILYCWAPKIRVRWFDAGMGALAATFCWEVSKMGFTWYLESGLSKYQLIYGSLGTVIALMLWIYLSGLICLFGAHLMAQMVGRRQT